MTTARHLVVLASAEPSATDSLADLLRDICTVRTAYTTEEVLDRLDGEVDVVLVDPALAADAVALVTEAVEGRALDCQVGVLDAAERDDDGVDDVVSPSLPDERIRDRVVELGRRAQYRKALESYYALAETNADADEADPDRPDPDRLQERLDRLESRLEDAAESLDAAALFEAALGDCDDEIED